MTVSKIHRPRGPRNLTLLVLTLAAACAGCTAPYNWIIDDYAQAEQRAREANKPLFVYYRWWMSAECGVVERDVLDKPQIHRLFRDGVNCWLHQDWPANQEIMKRFGVDTVPAFVIVTPDGTVHKRTGTPTADQFERFVRQAMPEPTATNKKPPSNSAPAEKPAPADRPPSNAEKRP